MTVPGRPTFLWTDCKNAKDDVAAMGAKLVDDYQEATVHIVDRFESPGQRVTWLSKLGGHLVATKHLKEGPWIQRLGTSISVNDDLLISLSMTIC